MEMHQLRYVIAVARTGNFSRAAEQCHVAQPSLSQQILKLEEELGERLFERLRRETKLTAAGERFLTRARRILEEAEAAQREIAEARQLLSGTLTIGVLPTIAPYLMPEVVAEFTERFPGVELLVHEETTARLLKLVQSYEVDLAIVSPPLLTDRLETKFLLRDELLLALPPDHRLVHKKRITPADFAQERLIVMKEGHCLGDQVLQFCELRQQRPVIRFRSAQLETIQSLVTAGLGISLIPTMAMLTGRNALPVYRSFPQPKPYREIVACWPQGRVPSRAAGEFLAALVRQCEAKSNP
jgi:LysR family transcriptional regulator, hydrogen peroxide-inducible genes activator